MLFEEVWKSYQRSFASLLSSLFFEIHLLALHARGASSLPTNQLLVVPQAQKRSFLSLYGHTLRNPVTRTVPVTPGLCRHRIKGRHISWFPPSLLTLHILHEHTTTHSQRTNNVIRQSLRTVILLRRQGPGIPRWVWVYRCPTGRRAINSSRTGSRTVRCAHP